MGSLPAGTGCSGRLLVEVSVMSEAPLPGMPRVKCGSRAANPGMGVTRPAAGDGSGPSMGSLIPRGADTDAHLQRHAQTDCGGHAMAHQRTHLICLSWEDLDNQLIVHLQQQP